MKYSTKAWLIWGCAGIFYLYEMILRASPSVMTDQLMQHFAVTSTSLGLLTSFYYYAYFPLQIPCGLIVDRLGTRRVITFSAVLCTIGSFIFAGTDVLEVAQLGRFLIGAGSACAFISCLKIGSAWFLPAQFALISGLTNMMGTIGGTFSGPPFAFLVNTYGWQSAMQIGGIIGVFVAILSWMVIRDKRVEAEGGAVSSPFETYLSLIAGLTAIVKRPQNWLIAVYGGLMYVPISAFCELWAVPFLMKTYSINNEGASMASIMVFLGTAVGSPLAAWLSDFWQSRRRVMFLSVALTTVMFGIISVSSFVPLTLMFILLFLAGVSSSGQILCFVAIQETVPNHLSATSVGFTNAIVMMSGIIFQPLLGYVLDLFWDGCLLEDGVTRVYDCHAYQSAIMAVPVGMIMSGILLLFVKDTFNAKKHKALEK